MTERAFLIQRYCQANQPQVRGLRPFITTGPSFLEWIVPGSLEKRGQHVLRPKVKRMLFDLFPTGGIHRMHYQHVAVAESLLRERVLLALWSVDSRECLPEPDRWAESIDQVARELPFKTAERVDDSVEYRFWSIDESVEALLSGMCTPAMVREYVSEDKLCLVPALIPVS